MVYEHRFVSLPVAALRMLTIYALFQLALSGAVLCLESYTEQPASKQDVLPRDWPFIPIAGSFMVLSWLLTRFGVPETNISGTMMAVLSFLWWNIRIDPRTSPTVFST